ncbi:MAG: N-acetyl-anhydromuranmyl-L-alanine amidase [Syntrophaceae bacterium PtaU1.Bin231]|nr:MAG: N-acetyl-anhydromuranmyl-L-alanine amidase [Syntrophaceae bacterium PtaU1.Bin231]
MVESRQEENGFPIHQLPIVSGERLRLMRLYAEIHYGLDSFELKDPRMIVVHYTALPTFEESLEFLRPDELSTVRDDIQAGGTVNVGSHYLVDRNGAIYQIMPDDVMARHTIGFNHVSISIENVGRDRDHLTEAQIAADAFVIHRLCRKYPGIEYLIGHQEYMRRDLPHFVLFRELDPSYRFTVKQDPGSEFMVRLRKELSETYKLKLKD